MSIEAMKQALDVLENTARSAVEQYVAEQKAITALRQAIEQAEKQEKLCKYCGGMGRVVCNGRCMPEQEPVAYKYTDKTNPLVFYFTTHKDSLPNPDVIETALYAAPPKREIDMSTKPEKIDTSAERVHETDKSVHEDDDIQEYKKPWVSLTDEEVIEWVESGEYNVITNDWASHIEFARAIEAKLKEKNNAN